MINTRRIGVEYETQAVQYLKEKGYGIIERNYKNVLGELDIIATDHDTIVFVEVKHRRDARFGMPIEAITPQKVHKIKLVATSYLKNKRWLERKVRFDAIEILGEKIRHIENCF